MSRLTEIGAGVVLKPWVTRLPWKEQSKLLSSFRGPDTSFSHEIKAVTKFIRASAQFDADPETDYMAPREISFKALEREIEFCTVHYICHLLEALELVARYARPEGKQADEILDWFAETFHLRLESDV